MYEGKNIHYSPLDNKPLCSFSGKLCKQRRLNGYALCLRHVLEDPDAPFRQCTYMVRNKQQCTNPIHQSNASQYCTSHMQHLGLLPLSTKAASKATKNGQHNHHSFEHSTTRILSKLGHPVDLLPSLAELPKTAANLYQFHDVDVKTVSTVAIDKGLSSAAKSIPIARLYPELAEKLDLESDGHKAVNLGTAGSRSQPLNHVSAATVDKALTDGVRQCSSVNRPTVASLTSVVGTQFPVSIAPSSRASVKPLSSNTPNPPRLMLDPIVSSTAAVVSLPLMQYSWQMFVSGGSAAASVVPTSQHLLTQALQGLLSATSLSAHTVSTACSKFATARSEASVSSIRLNQNAPHRHSLPDTTLFDTGKMTAKLRLPVVESQTVAASRNTAEDASHLKPWPCMACMVRPRPRPDWRQRKDIRLKQKSLHKSAWKLYSDHAALADCSAEILPCGIDSSDDDSDLELQVPRQRLWPGLSSDEEEEHDFDLADEVAVNIRRTKLLLLKSRERRRFTQLQLRHHGNQSVRQRQSNEDLALVTATRHSELSAALALQMLLSSSTQQHSRSSAQRTKPVDELRRPCLYKGEDDVSCGHIALPFTNHCLQHIMYNVDQQLFSYCTGKSTDNTQCCVPVFDITHELPLCHEHFSKAENNQQTDCDSKPKKKRKKTKPSALTRPPKKGKKKKKIQQKMFYLNSALSSLPEAAAEEPVAMDTDNVGSTVTEGTSSLSSQQPVTSPVAMAACSLPDSSIGLLASMPKVSLDEVALDLAEPFSLATSLELPLDTDQATKFLDEHDLHDVLNKLPDEAFDLLTGKNGEYSLARDVDEAFTRALADVSKPFVVDSRDDSLSSHFQATSRLPDSVPSLNDEELMKHLASVLFSRSATNAMEDELADSIGDFSTSDLHGITQALPASSAWGTVSVDCDSVSSDTKSTHRNPESVGIPNGIVDLHTHVTTSSVSSANSGTSVVLSSSAVTTSKHSVSVSLPSLSVATCSSCMSVKDGTVSSTAQTDVGGTSSSFDGLLTPVLASPLLHVGSLAALPQVLVSAPGGSLLVSTTPGLQQLAVGLPSLQTLPDVHTLMKPARRYVVDSRPMVTSGLSALPLASIFTPFSTAFCPPPPVPPSSSVIKMDHPLAAATVLATVSVPSCSPLTVCSPGIATVSSVTPSVSVGQTVFLPSTPSSNSFTISCQTSSSGT